jgi:hypothetical protein
MTAAPLPQIDAASLVAFPAERPSLELHAREVKSARALCAEALAGEPLLTHIFDSPYGRVGTILIPVVDMTLFEDRATTVAAAVAGVDLARRAGARCVSFTGMIPAATGFGTAIAEVVRAEGGPALSLTTGHAAVVAAFAFNVATVLEGAGRRYEDETAAFVGVGSIGTGIVKLLNETVPPKRIYLVDVPEKSARLAQLKTELPGEVEVVTIDRASSLPDWMYERCTLLLTATSSPLVVDVDKLRPGTLMIDDSFPFGFDSEKAAARVVADSDIVLTIAGGLRGPNRFTLAETATMAEPADFSLLVERMAGIISPWPDCMTGCVYSSLITSRFDLPETIGPVTYEEASLYHRTLKDENFSGMPPHIFTFDRGHDQAILRMPEGPMARPAP